MRRKRVRSGRMALSAPATGVGSSSVQASRSTGAFSCNRLCWPGMNWRVNRSRWISSGGHTLRAALDVNWTTLVWSNEPFDGLRFQ